MEGLSGDIRSVNLADQDNLLMELRSGHSVRLGSSDNLHAKLKSLKYTARELTGRTDTTGTIDVSDPENPTYIPE